MRGGLPSLLGLPVRSAAVPSRQAQSTASEGSQVQHGGLGPRTPLWLGHIQPPSPRHLPPFHALASSLGSPKEVVSRGSTPGGSRLRIWRWPAAAKGSSRGRQDRPRPIGTRVGRCAIIGSQGRVMGRGEVVPNPSGTPRLITRPQRRRPTLQMMVENAQAQANQRSGNAGRVPSRCCQAAVPPVGPGQAPPVT